MVHVRPLPVGPAEWRGEVVAAYKDALEALPLAPLVRAKATEHELFHFAPHVAVKFRGLPKSRGNVAVEAALSSYVASNESGNLDEPHLAFAFCYLASHFGLGLISEATVNEVMTFLEATLPELIEAMENKRCLTTGSRGRPRLRRGRP